MVCFVFETGRRGRRTYNVLVLGGPAHFDGYVGSRAFKKEIVEI